MTCRRTPGLLALLPVALAAALAGCSPHLEGNGVYAERTFTVPAFDRVAVGLQPAVAGDPMQGSILVDAGAPAHQVVLSGDENIIAHIEAWVDAGTLKTRADSDLKDGFNAFHPPQLRVRTPTLVGVEAVSGTVATVDGAAAPSFAVASTGGQVLLHGAGGGGLVVALSGQARLDASGYPTTTAQVALSGGSSATVWPEEPVTGSAADGSAVLVKGGAGCAVVLASGSTCGPIAP